MRLCEIEERADGHNSGRINFSVGHVIMTLDVIEIDRVGNSWLLIQIHQITLQVRVIDDAAQIAFEVSVINDVEPDERAEKSPVGFDDPVLEKKTAL